MSDLWVVEDAAVVTESRGRKYSLRRYDHVHTHTHTHTYTHTHTHTHTHCRVMDDKLFVFCCVTGRLVIEETRQTGSRDYSTSSLCVVMAAVVRRGGVMVTV